jgi:ABC-type spermidine/putrescine transport system permease subunit II
VRRVVLCVRTRRHRSVLLASSNDPLVTTRDAPPVVCERRRRPAGPSASLRSRGGNRAARGGRRCRSGIAATSRLWRNLCCALATVLPAIALALLLAVSLKESSGVKVLLRTIFFFPVLLPLVAAATLPDTCQARCHHHSILVCAAVVDAAVVDARRFAARSGVGPAFGCCPVPRVCDDRAFPGISIPVLSYWEFCSFNSSTITLVGYAFARLTFSGRDLIFYPFLLQIALAAPILIVPNTVTLVWMDLYDSLLGVMAPYFASAFGIFLMRQTFKSIPRDFEEADIGDGASLWQLIRLVRVPLARPGLIAFSIISLTNQWNEFLWPLMITDGPDNMVLTVGLSSFVRSDKHAADCGLMAAATLLVAAPLLIAFVLFQRQFVNSFVFSGVT